MILLSGVFAVPSAGEDFALRIAFGLLALFCSLLATFFGISLFKSHSKGKTLAISATMIPVAITSGWMMTIPILMLMLGVGLVMQSNKT